MRQILHGCAKRTEAVRSAIQESKESIKALSEKYSVNLKTIRKWTRRNHVHDSPMGGRTLIPQCLAWRKKLCRLS
jgi:hypothetical protein